jgi:hypothetical protein
VLICINLSRKTSRETSISLFGNGFDTERLEVADEPGFPNISFVV